MKALVFGGTRYLGAHVVNALLEHAQVVSVLDFACAAEPGSEQTCRPDVPTQLLGAECRSDSGLISVRFDPSDFDVVIFCGVDGYCAGAGRPPTSQELACERAVLDVLLAGRPKAVVLGSSAVVYQAAGSGEIDEQSPTRTDIQMARHFLSLERSLLGASQAVNLPVSILRCSIVAGIRDAIPYCDRALKLGYLVPGITVTGDLYPNVNMELDGTRGGFEDHNVMDFVHVADAASAFALAAASVTEGGRSGGVYNVGSSAPSGIGTTLAFMAENKSVSLSVVAMPSDDGIPHSVLSTDTIRGDLEWVPMMPQAIIITNEIRYFVGMVLARKNISQLVRVRNEHVGSWLSSKGFTIFGILVTLDRTGDLRNEDLRFEVSGKFYHGRIATRRGIRVPFKSVRLSPYRMSIPREDLRHLPIQNAIRTVYVSPEGLWARRRLRYSMLRKPKMHHGVVRWIPASNSTLYLRQAGKMLYLTLRVRNVTDRLSVALKIRLARLASMLRNRPIVMLYEKEAGRYEESASVVFEAMVDRGRTDVRYVLAEQRFEDVPEKYRRFVIKRFSFRHFYSFFCTHTFIGTEAVAHAAELRTADRTLLKKLFGGGFAYVFLQHGVMYMVALSSTQRAPFRSGGSVIPAGTKIVVSSELEARHFVELGGFSREDLYTSGLPKFDRASRDADAELILIMPTWRPWEHNTIRIEPHNAPYYRMLVELLEAVPSHLRDKARIMPHPLLTSVLAETELGEHMWDGGSYDDALRKCSVLITDYSSIAYDAFYRGANVIFWWKEKDMCMQQYGGHLMLDEKSVFGPVCNDAGEVHEAVTSLHRTAQDDESLRRFKRIVEFHDGRNTARLLGFLERDGLLDRAD